MYDTDTRTRFIKLRAKGWSIKRIAARMKVSARTLVEWSRQDRETIRTLRAIELEALQEKILDTREQELRTLQSQLTAIEEQISLRPHQFVSLENLYRLAALLRTEIRKVCQTPDFSDPTFPDELQFESACKTPCEQTIPSGPESALKEVTDSPVDDSSCRALPAPFQRLAPQSKQQCAPTEGQSSKP
jgi:transcriptional regulator with XRE-family HTH domain